MNLLRTLLLLTALFCGSLIASQAQAQISCNVTFNTLAFPTTMDVLPGASFDTASTVASSCTGITGTTKVLLCYALNSGTYPVSGTQRQMGSGTNRLLFQAYVDSGRLITWGTSGTGLLSVVLTATAPSATTSYYGRVAASQPAAVPAAYSTTMTVTVSGTAYTGATPACPTAALATFTFNATGTVISSCNATATNLVFPSTSFFTANIDGTSTVRVTCTNTTPYHVRLSGGTVAATDPAQRKMSLGVNQITYGLYRDTARSLGWGSTDNTNTLDATGTASATNHTVYGRIPPQSSVPPGPYTDTVVVTVSFL